MNEPNGNLTPALWNNFAAEALSVIRETNPERVVVVGTPEWGGIGGLGKLDLPDDENLIVTIHYYNPFEFTHQGADWSNMQDVKDIKWHDSEIERQTVSQEFEAVEQYAQSKNVPIHIGEFGAYSKADLESRVRWTTFLSRWFEEQGFSWAYWEFSAGFGIYNPTTKDLLQPLADALLHNPLPEPAKLEVTPIYKSNFTNNTDGWFLNCRDGSSATSSIREGELQVHIAKYEDTGWYIQLVKTNFSLEKEQSYRISFTASSSLPVQSIGNYLGRNADPWDLYSGYNQFSSTNDKTTFSYVFTMKENDPVARFVFDLGTIQPNTTISFSDIQLDKIRIVPASTSKVAGETNVNYHFNPVDSRLYIANNSLYDQALIYTISGSLAARHPLVSGANEISCIHYPSGVYIIALEGKGKSLHTFKIKK